MLRRLINMIVAKRRAQYSQKKISDALDILAHNIAKIGLSAQIVSPMFQEEIKGRKFYVSRETMPLVIILQDAIRFIYGRLGRCYFDGQLNNNTASIRVLIDQIFNDISAAEDRKVKFKTQFDAITEKFKDVEKYKKRLKTYSDKHYAHADIKSLKELEVEEVKISIPWNELVSLITQAREILRDMFTVCQKPPFDFSEYVYEEYTDQFWKLINFTEVNVVNQPKNQG